MLELSIKYKLLELPFFKTQSTCARNVLFHPPFFFPSAFLHVRAHEAITVCSYQTTWDIHITEDTLQKAFQPDLSSTHTKPSHLCSFHAKNLGAFQWRQDLTTSSLFYCNDCRNFHSQDGIGLFANIKQLSLYVILYTYIRHLHRTFLLQ